ncbi:MAG: S8 family serine peptidase [Actinomycetota bacterium]
MTLPAWSSAFADEVLATVPALPLPAPTRDWAWGGATGRGVKVAVVDSGVDADHPRVGGIAGAVALELDSTSPDGVRYVLGPHEDLVGHGTACAGIIRSLAPEAEIYSVRVLGSNLKGKGVLFHAGIRWAIDSGMQVLNLSLSSSSSQWFSALHEIVDEAYFARRVLVCAANNMPGPTYPSQFASVVSVAARASDDPWAIAYNPHPPVEFGARGLDIDVAWSAGTSIVAGGNSFATPHVAGLVTLLLSKHPDLTPFQVKSVLQSVADNARTEPS